MHNDIRGTESITAVEHFTPFAYQNSKLNPIIKGDIQ
jgi:hypothetical protein